MTLHELKKQAEEHVIRNEEMIAAVLNQFADLTDQELYDKWLRDTHAPLRNIIIDMDMHPLYKGKHTLLDIACYTNSIVDGAADTSGIKKISIYEKNNFELRMLGALPNCIMPPLRPQNNEE